MKMMTLAKIALVACAMTLPAGLASAKTIKLAPGACAFEKSGIASNSMCSYQCNPQNGWCSQQLCVNGVLTPMVPCYGSFCTPKCGG